jgi:AcrR family transcriptional regulator
MRHQLQYKIAIDRVAAKRSRERGLEGIGVADVMKEAGVTVAGFYEHFGSRDELVVEALATAFKDLDDWEDATSPELPDEGTPRCAGNWLCDGSVTRRHDSGRQIRAGPLYGAGEAERGILYRPSSVERARG